MKLPDRIKYGLIPGFLIQFCLGSIYSWPILENSLVSVFGSECANIFNYFILITGLSSLIVSSYVENNLIKSNKISSGLFIIGTLLTISSYYLENFILFIISFLGVMAVSIGIGFLSSLKNIITWYNSPGKGIGILLTSFAISRGISAMLFSKASESDYSEIIFLSIAVINIIIMILCGKIMKPNVYYYTLGNVHYNKDGLLKTIVTTPKLWSYWLIMFFGLISFSAFQLSHKTNTTSITGIDLTWSFLMIGTTINILGRIITTFIMDKLKHLDKIIGLIMYLSVVICVIGFINEDFIPVSNILTNLFYGVMFTIIPLALLRRYGYSKFSKTYGFCFSAWILGSLVGRFLNDNLIQYFPSNTSRTVMLLFTAIYFIGLYYSTEIWENNRPSQKP